jgi:hypothetical protein
MPRGIGLMLTVLGIVVAIAVSTLAEDNVGFAVLGGVTISIVAWLATLVFVGPRVSVSQAISVVKDAGPERSDIRYRVKVLNRSRWFDVSNLELQAQLVIRGLNPRKPKNATTFAIPVATETPFPVLHRRSRQWRKKKPGWQRRRAGRSYTLRHRQLGGGGTSRLTQPIVARLRAGELELPELLATGDDAFVRLVVSAAHPLSGYHRSVVVIYEASDLQEGTFEDHDSVELTPTHSTDG